MTPLYLNYLFVKIKSIHSFSSFPPNLLLRNSRATETLWCRERTLHWEVENLNSKPCSTAMDVEPTNYSNIQFPVLE